MQQGDAEFATDAADQHVEHVGIGIVAIVVDVLAEFGAADDAVRVVHQIGEDPVLLRGQRQRIAIEREAARVRVELQRATPQARRCMAGAAADQRVQAQHQFLDLERLGQVIVGARVEAGEFVVPAATRGQHQHRQRLPGLAPAVQHGHAVEPGQAEVEHGGVVGLGLAAELGLGAVVDAIHRETGRAQRRGDAIGQFRIVLGQKNPHQSSISISSRRPSRAS